MMLIVATTHPEKAIIRWTKEYKTDAIARFKVNSNIIKELKQRDGIAHIAITPL
jgi:hypothetical protein